MSELIKRPDYYLKPAFLFALAVATIFVIELTVMFFLRSLPNLSPTGEALVDAVLLSLSSIPILYFLLFKPLRANIQDRTRAELEEKKTIEISHMKSEFIAIAAHELRTPLTAIMGYSELLLMKKEFNAEHIKTITQSADVMERLIDDLSDLSLSERGKPLQIQKKTSDIIPMLEAVLQKSKKKYPLRHLVVSLPKKKVRVQFDKIRIEQVLENLLSNANKFSSTESPVMVNATLHNKKITVLVRDQGIGMSQAESAQIFNKFYRGNFSNSAPSGLGLGMTIVKEIVSLHGGEVRIESTPEVGTTVSFSLPTC